MKARSKSSLVSIPVDWVREHGLEEDPWVELFVDREILIRPLRQKDARAARASGGHNREEPGALNDPACARKRSRSGDGACG